MEDRPAEVAQAFLLFLQGIGFCKFLKNKFNQKIYLGCDLDIVKIVSTLKGELQSINNNNKPRQILTLEKVDEFN